MAEKDNKVLEDFSDMLNSENFADATIVCGDRTWRESTTARVEIQDYEAEQVEWMIKFIYAGKASFVAKRLTKKTTVHATCVKLFITGDYFQLPRLVNIACEALMAHNRNLAPDYQRAVIKSRREHRYSTLSRPPIKFFDDAYLQRFFQQAKIVFDNDLESWKPIREAFYHFFDCTRFFVLEDDRIHNYLDNVPRLAQLLLRRLSIVEQIFDHSLPNACDDCGRIALESNDKELFFLTTRPVEDLDSEGYSRYRE